MQRLINKKWTDQEMVKVRDNVVVHVNGISCVGGVRFIEAIYDNND